MTKYVVQYKDEAFIKFDRITQGIGIKSRIVTLVEPVYSYKSASEFSSEESARDIINTVEDYDTTEFNIRNVDILEQEAKERAEQEAKDFMKQTWRNTSEERQKEILKDMKYDDMLSNNFYPIAQESLRNLEHALNVAADNYEYTDNMWFVQMLREHITAYKLCLLEKE